MPPFRLISNLLCPYTQRVAIQLAEKHLPFVRVYLDLGNKPDWFARLSPLGKVPLLQVSDDLALFETSAICEYLEDAHPSKAMHPANALVRARHRGWIEAASATIADVFGLYMAPDAVGLERKAADLQSRCRALEVALSPQGPWFDGTDFALVDAAWAPVFRLFDTLEPLAGIAPGAACPTLARYRAALAQRPSVQAAAGPDYGKHFEAYLRQRGSHLSRLMASVPA